MYILESTVEQKWHLLLNAMIFHSFQDISDEQYDTKTIDTTDTNINTDGIDTEYWTKSILILIGLVGGNWAGSKQSHHVL